MTHIVHFFKIRTSFKSLKPSLVTLVFSHLREHFSRRDLPRYVFPTERNEGKLSLKPIAVRQTR